MSRKPLPPPPPALGAKHVALAAAACGGVTWLLYAGTLQAPFVYDDVVIFSDACRPCRPERLAELWDVVLARGLPRPVTMLSFALNHYAGGPQPYGYRLVNLALHALVGTALFVFSCRLLTLLPAARAWRDSALPIAAAGTLVWLVHPVHAQVAAYIWQRSTSLSALFFLGSLLAYLEARWGAGRPRWLLFAASAALGLLALGAKQNAGVLPLFMLLLEAAFHPEGRPWGRSRLAWGAALAAAFVGIAASYLGPRFLTLMAGDFQRRGFTAVERLLTELRVVAHYLTLLALPLPSRLNLDYDFPLSHSLLDPPSTLACLAVVGFLLGLAVWRFDRRRLLAVAILWFFGGLVVESTVIPLDLVYEHRLYLPSMVPLVFLAGLVLRRLAGRPGAAAAALGAVLLLLSVATAARARVWADPVWLFTDTARKSPNKARVHANLGNAYLDRRDYAGAQRAFARALELDPGLTGAANNLALVLLDHLGQPAEARRLLEDAARRHPDDAGTRINLAAACARLGDRAEAERQLEAAREIGQRDLR